MNWLGIKFGRINGEVRSDKTRFPEENPDSFGHNMILPHPNIEVCYPVTAALSCVYAAARLQSHIKPTGDVSIMRKGWKRLHAIRLCLFFIGYGRECVEQDSKNTQCDIVDP